MELEGWSISGHLRVGEGAVMALGSVESAQKSIREVWTGSATNCAGDRAFTLRKRC